MKTDSRRVPTAQAAAEMGMSIQGMREYMKKGLIDIGEVLPAANGETESGIMCTGTSWTGIWVNQNYEQACLLCGVQGVRVVSQNCVLYVVHKHHNF